MVIDWTIGLITNMYCLTFCSLLARGRKWKHMSNRMSVCFHCDSTSEYHNAIISEHSRDTDFGAIAKEALEAWVFYWNRFVAIQQRPDIAGALP